MIKIHIENRRHKQTSVTFTALVCGFQSDVTAVLKGETINAKSIMKAPDIEMASEMEFIVDGKDEKEVADAICNYFESNNE